MRFAKTFCKPSSSIEVVPAGLPVILKYNEHGLIQGFSIGFDIGLDPDYDDPDVGEFNYNELFARIKQFVPSSITAKGGTTWIFGVFYSERIPCDEGLIPQALYKSYIRDIISGGHYTFYAGYVHSLAASFRGPLVIRNFLGANKFNLLPHVVVPLTMTDETLNMMMSTGTYSFRPAFIAGFFIFEDLGCRYASSFLLQLTVSKDIEPFIESDGFLKGEIVTRSGRSYTFNYSALLHHSVSKGCTILVERSNEEGGLNILATRAGEGADIVPETIDHDIKCPVCGKIYRAGSSDAPVQCDDPHCLSHEYDNACKLLDTLNLPGMSYNSYKALVDSKKIICLTDLLELPPAKDQEVRCSLATAMYAVIPTSVVPNYQLLERFANKCNNNVSSVVYYLENPRRIETDLDITDVFVKRLVDWLEDPYNITTLTTIFAQVKIDEKLQKFDGAPIFRGNTIAVTGKFKRGSYPEIESILRSYAANVVPSIELGEDLPDVVLVGSLQDGIDGKMIQKAKAHGIPISYEDDFFVRYEIDQDLAQNLL